MPRLLRISKHLSSPSAHVRQAGLAVLPLLFDPFVATPSYIGHYGHALILLLIVPYMQHQIWSGPAFFGLQKTEVRALVERLPGAQRCTCYTRWALGSRPPGTGPTQLANFSVRLRRDLANTPMLECLKLVKEIMAHRCSWPFLEPVKNAHRWLRARVCVCVCVRARARGSPTTCGEGCRGWMTKVRAPGTFTHAHTHTHILAHHTHRGLEDYGSRIRRPMDLGTVLEKLKNDNYRNPHQCRCDVIQVLVCA